MSAPVTNGAPANETVLDRENVRAVAAARGLAPEDLDIRLRADASSALVVLVLFSAAIVWLLIGSIFGDIASLKLHWPDFLTRQGWLTFGRVRTAHLHAVNYGWATAALIGTSLWLIPRLVHTELRGVVVGYSVFWAVTDQGELGNLATTPMRRRQGIGRKLLEAAIEAASRRGVKELFLEVRVSNHVARALYDAYGFREVGRRRNYYAAPVEDALVLRCALAPRPDTI